MKKFVIIVVLGFISIFSAVQAAHVNASGRLYVDDLNHPISNGSLKNFSGYDGQPVLYTGAQSHGYWGSLGVMAGSKVTFTYLGQESAYVDKFVLSTGEQLLETDAIGKSISISVASEGFLNFSFIDTHPNPDKVFTNGTQQTGVLGFMIMKAAMLGNGVGRGFDYYIGFNDTYSGDADYDDFVVGVKASAVPVPAAVWLFGSALMGLFGVSRRKAAGLVN